MLITRQRNSDDIDDENIANGTEGVYVNDDYASGSDELVMILSVKMFLVMRSPTDTKGFSGDDDKSSKCY